MAQAAGIADGTRVRLRQAGAETVLTAVVDPRLAPGCVRVAAGHPDTAALPAHAGPIAVEPA